MNYALAFLVALSLSLSTSLVIRPSYPLSSSFPYRAGKTASRAPAAPSCRVWEPFSFSSCLKSQNSDASDGSDEGEVPLIIPEVVLSESPEVVASRETQKSAYRTSMIVMVAVALDMFNKV